MGPAASRSYSREKVGGRKLGRRVSSGKELASTQDDSPLLDFFGSFSSLRMSPSREYFSEFFAEKISWRPHQALPVRGSDSSF